MADELSAILSSVDLEGELIKDKDAHSFIQDMKNAITEEDARKAALEAQGGMAFINGAIDTASLGSADYLMSEDKLKQNAEIADANPLASLFGNMAGGAATMLPITRVVNAAAKTPGVIGQAARLLGSSPGSRTLGAGAVGAIEGGVYNYNKGESVIDGIKTGAIFGASGQAVLGELLPGLYKHTLGGGKPSQQDIRRAHKNVADLIKLHNPNIDDAGVQQLVNTLEEMGPDAKLMDVDEALYKAGVDLVSNRHSSSTAKTLASSIKDRFAKNQKGVETALLDAMSGAKVYSPGAARLQAKQTMQYYQPAYKAALENSSVKLDYQDAIDTVYGKFGTLDPVTGVRHTTQAAERAQKSAIKSLRSNSTINGQKPKGGVWQADGTYRVQLPDLPDGTKQYEWLTPDPLSATAVDVLIKDLDAAYKDASNPFGAKAANKGLAKDLATLRSEYKAFLDSDDALATVRRSYADEHDYNTGYEYGQKLITEKKVDVAALRGWMSSASDIEQMALLNGLKYELSQKLNEGGVDAFGKLLSKSSRLRGVLNDALGEALADPMISAADAVSKYSSRDRKFVDAMSNPAKKTDTGGLIADAAIGLGGLLTDKVSNIAGAGAARRSASRLHPTANVTDEAISEILSQSGDEAATTLSNLLRAETYGPALTASDAAMGVGGVAATAANETNRE